MNIRSSLTLSLSLCMTAALADDKGTWTSTINWQFFGIHMTLLPNEKLLLMNRHRMNNAETATLVDFATKVANPGTNYAYDSLTNVSYYDPEDHELFCAGHTLLPNGDVFVSGGHFHEDYIGLPDLHVFHSSNSTWEAKSVMTDGRWYPTTVHLPDGRLFFAAGTIDAGSGGGPTINNLPEFWLDGVTPNGDPTDCIAPLPATHALDRYYPQIFVDPTDGNLVVFAKGRSGDTGTLYDHEKLNLRTLGWADYRMPMPSGVPNVRWQYPSAAMLDGIVVRTGGSINTGTDDAVKTANYCDLNDTTTSTSSWWKNCGTTGEMQVERKNHTLVALPNGRVLAMGGNFDRDGNSQNSQTRPETQPEWWDPASPSTNWSLLEFSDPDEGSDRIIRGYHSTALLLPDARVIVAGGEPERSGDTLLTGPRSAQIFSPPYGGINNWASTRPSLSSVPTEIRYGSSFTVSASPVSPGTAITKMRLISLGSTTHAFNQNQRLVTCSQLGSSGTITVYPPSSTAVATPGYYMLFAVDDRGVPSIAKIVRLRDYDRAALTAVDVTAGSMGSGTYETVDRLWLPENLYLANSIASVGGNTATIELNATSPSSTSAQIRIQVECKTTTTTSITPYLWNWSNSQWESDFACPNWDRRNGGALRGSHDVWQREPLYRNWRGDESKNCIRWS